MKIIKRKIIYGKDFLIERKKRSYEQFQDKIFKNCMQSALGSVFVDFCVRISSQIADLFYAVCGGNDFCDDRKSDGEVSGETDQN